MVRLVLLVAVFVFSPCSGKIDVTDDELKKLSELLLENDVNNAAQFVQVNPQGRTNGGSERDEASSPLLTVDKKAFSIPTVSKLIKLYDNYEPDTTKNENVTPTEKEEESEFLNAVLKTPVMNKTKAWLVSKGLIDKGPGTLKKMLEDVWFTIYSRGQQKKSSSAFEHIFLGEMKNGAVSGLHNWVYFNNEEQSKKLNYLGWMRKLDFAGKKGSLMKLHYKWEKFNKPVGTLFIGTSPELELALYTVCYLTRPNDKCNISLGSQNVFIQTYTFSDHNNRKIIGSAYPGL